MGSEIVESKVKFGSVCSGIEAASVAWHPLGWETSWLAEIDKFPSQLLANHYPDIANHGDLNDLPALVSSGRIEAPEVLIGGTPCQAFSLAGLRNSLDDDRGQLTLKFVELANEIDRTNGDSTVIVWENVPGVLSTKDNAFGNFLAGLAGESVPLEPAGRKWTNAGCVFGPQRAVAWRVLDAQYFGVAQRRRRVFVVASARDGFDPCKVLFEFKSSRRDAPPSREAEKAVAALTANGVGTCGADDNQTQAGHLVPGNPLPGDLGRCLTASGSSSGRLDPNEQDFVVSVDTRQDPQTYEEHTGPITASTPVQAVIKTSNTKANGSNITLSDGPAYTLDRSAAGMQAVVTDTVRRLTPVECERLQGFPDNHTACLSDSQRYKALGNSMAVPVIRWIGERIQKELNNG